MHMFNWGSLDFEQKGTLSPGRPCQVKSSQQTVVNNRRLLSAFDDFIPALPVSIPWLQARPFPYIVSRVPVAFPLTTFTHTFEPGQIDTLESRPSRHNGRPEAQPHSPAPHSGTI